MRPDIYLAYLLLRLLGLLPLRGLHACGAGIGWLMFHLGRGVRHTVAVNLAIARPELGFQARAELTRKALQEAGKAAVELAGIWGRRPVKANRLVREVVGEALLREAAVQDKGVVVIAPHLGCWEILSYWVGARFPLAVVYRPPRIAALEVLLRRVRGVLSIGQIRADGAGVRQLYKWLAKGGQVAGVLPDQKPRAGEGQFAPFFGREALTMVLIPRLAARAGIHLVYGFAERLPKGRGYRLHFLPVAPEIRSADLRVACTALNQGVEACVARAFSQYQWTYRRYGDNPETGESQPYR